MNLQEELRAARAATERAIKQREAELRRFAGQAEALGRQVYDKAIRTGERVLARTPSEIRALGIAAAQGRLPQALGEKIVKEVVRNAVAPTPKAPTKPPPRPPANGPSAATTVAREFEAGVSGLVDEVSLGLADPILAAGNAAKVALEGGDATHLLRDYRASMAEKAAKDEYDAAHHGLSRNVGRGVGLAGSMLAMGAPGAIRALAFAVPRSRAALQAARLGLKYAPDARRLTAMMASQGAAAGVVNQALSDTLTGHQSSPAEIGGAIVSGAVDGGVTRFAGPMVGGAAGGAVSSWMDDAANGRDASLDGALEAAQAGALLGKAGGSLGARALRKMPIGQKGRLGEAMSNVKTALRGDEIIGNQRRVYLQPTGSKPEYTVADGISISPQGRLRLIESKAGTEGELTDRQIQALEQYGDDYIVDYWRPSDIGKFVGTGFAPLGAHLLDQDPRPRRHQW